MVSFTVTTHSKEEIADFIINIKKLDYVTDYQINTVSEEIVELYDLDGNRIYYTMVDGVVYDEEGNVIPEDLIEGSNPYKEGKQKDIYDVKLYLKDPNYVTGETEDGVDPTVVTESSSVEDEIGGLE